MECFAGRASFSKAMCKLGFTVHAYDIQWGRGGDILDPTVFRKLKTALDTKVFSFVVEVRRFTNLIPSGVIQHGVLENGPSISDVPG